MVTPFGSVFDQPEIPSGMESYAYFQQQKQQKQALEQQKKLAEQKARQEADQEFTKTIKPLQELKTTTGFTDRAPEAYMTAKVQEAQQKATEMYRAGRPASEVSAYIQNTVRGVDGMRNWLNNSQAALEQQIATLSKDSGLDPAKLRELGTVELLYTDDGKGGKRLRTLDEMNDVTNILPAILEKHADKINVTNRDKIYKKEPDADYREDHKQLRTADGRVVYGTATGKYNSLYQRVEKDKDHSLRIVTNGVPAMKDGEPVIGPDGKPITVLTPQAYLDFIQNPGAIVELGKEVKKKKADLMQQYEYEAGQKASEELNYRYGMKLKELPAAKRLKMKEDLKKQYLETMDMPDDEIIRQQAAYELVDKNMPKNRINTNELRDPSIRVTNNYGGSGGRKTGNKPDVDYNNVYQRIKSAVAGGISFKGIKLAPLSSADIETEVKSHFIEQAKSLYPDEKFNVDELYLAETPDGKLYITAQDSNLKMSIDEYFTNARFNPTKDQRDKISKDVKNNQGPTPAPTQFIFPGGKNKF